MTINAVALLLLLALAIPAHARVYADRTLSWTCPTSRVDESAFICAVDAAGYDLEVTSGTIVTIRELPATATSAVINTDPAGTTYRLRVCDIAGECSVWSASVKKPVRPKATPLSVN